MFYTVSLVTGIILFLASLIILSRTLLFIRNSDRALGTVIALERVEDNDGVTYKPVFRFETDNKQEITYRHFASSAPAQWYVGEQVMIAYDRNDPATARLLTYFGTFSWTIVMMAISMPLLIVGGGYFLAQGFLKG